MRSKFNGTEDKVINIDAIEHGEQSSTVAAYKICKRVDPPSYRMPITNIGKSVNFNNWKQ